MNLCGPSVPVPVVMPPTSSEELSDLAVVLLLEASTQGLLEVITVDGQATPRSSTAQSLHDAGLLEHRGHVGHMHIGSGRVEIHTRYRLTPAGHIEASALSWRDT